MVHHYECECEVKVHPKRMWCAIVEDAHNCLPKCAGDKIASIDYEKHPVVQVGCIRTIHFHKPVHGSLYVKEEFEEVDKEKLKVTIKVIEGGSIGVLFKHYKFTMEFKEGPHPGTAVIHIKVHFEGLTKHEIPEELKEEMVKGIKAVEAFLLTNDLYA